MLADEALLLAELAAATGRSEDWWRRNWLRQHREHAFPRRLPGLWAWPRRAVALWLRTGGQTVANDDAPSAAAFLEQSLGVGS